MWESESTEGKDVLQEQEKASQGYKDYDEVDGEIQYEKKKAYLMR